MATHAGRAVRGGTGVSSTTITQLAWFLAGLALTFLIPFLFSSSGRYL